jgi:hypothetical protein
MRASSSLPILVSGPAIRVELLMVLLSFLLVGI